MSDDPAQRSWPFLLPDGLDAAAGAVGLPVPESCRAGIARVLDTLEKHAVRLREDRT